MKQGSFRTEQESFWAGSFGTDYIERNQGDGLLASNLAFFTKALIASRGLRSCVEFGANIGMNLAAIKLLFPRLDLHGIEINAAAADRLSEIIPPANVHRASILEWSPPRSYDLALIKGVLIHINPDALPLAYDKLAAATARYVLIAEYYNPSPVAIPYRGHENRLFKRDFAGEMLERHPQFQLVDYGFAYRRDSNFPQDDITWFLLEK